MKNRFSECVVKTMAVLLMVTLSACGKKSSKPTKVEVRDKGEVTNNVESEISKNVATSLNKGLSRAESILKSRWVRDSVNSVSAIVTRAPGSNQRKLNLFLSFKGEWKGKTTVIDEQHTTDILSQDPGKSDDLKSSSTFLGGSSESNSFSLKVACIDVDCDDFIVAITPKDEKGEGQENLRFLIQFETLNTEITSNFDSDLASLGLNPELVSATFDLVDGPRIVNASVRASDSLIKFQGIALGNIPLGQQSQRACQGCSKSKLLGLPTNDPHFSAVELNKFNSDENLITIKFKPDDQALALSFSIKEKRANSRKNTFDSKSIADFLVN